MYQMARERGFHERLRREGQGRRMETPRIHVKGNIYIGQDKSLEVCLVSRLHQDEERYVAVSVQKWTIWCWRRFSWPAPSSLQQAVCATGLADKGTWNLRQEKFFFQKQGLWGTDAIKPLRGRSAGQGVCVSFSLLLSSGTGFIVSGRCCVRPLQGQRKYNHLSFGGGGSVESGVYLS